MEKGGRPGLIEQPPKKIQKKSEPPHKTRRPSTPSTPLGRRGSPGRMPPQGGLLPRIAPTRATVPPRPGQRSWRALAPQLRAPRVPGVLRASAAAGWRRRWWSLLSVAVQHAVTTTALSGEWLLPATATSENAPHLAEVFDMAPPAAPSLLPLRG